MTGRQQFCVNSKEGELKRGLRASRVITLFRSLRKRRTRQSLKEIFKVPILRSTQSERDGSRILSRADRISTKGDAERAFRLYLEALSESCSHQYPITCKALELALTVYNPKWVALLLDRVENNSEIPKPYIAHIARVLASLKLSSGEPIDNEIAIMKRSCMDRQSAMFIRSHFDSSFAPKPSYELVSIEPFQRVLEQSVFSPCTHHQLKNEAKFLFSKPCRRPPLDVFRIERGTYFYNGSEFLILDKNGSVLDISRHSQFTFDEYQKISRSTATTISADRIFVAQDMSPSTNYAHWLCDWLPRILIYRDNYGRSAKVPFGQLITRFNAEYMMFVPICESVECREKKVIHAEEIVILSSSRDFLHPAYFGHKKCVEAVQRLRPTTGKSDATEKIYVSRGSSTGRTMVDEERLVEILQREGFRVVVPEQLAIAAQMREFSKATMIAGVHGAGLANMMFSSQCQKIVEIFPPDYGTPAFQMLADSMGIEYYYYYSGDEAPNKVNPAARYREFSVPIDFLAERIIEIGRMVGK